MIFVFLCLTYFTIPVAANGIISFFFMAEVLSKNWESSFSGTEGFKPTICVSVMGTVLKLLASGKKGGTGLAYFSGRRESTDFRRLHWRTAPCLTVQGQVGRTS